MCNGRSSAPPLHSPTCTVCRAQGFGYLDGDNGSPPGMAPTFFGEDACPLSFTGYRVPLRMPGGSSQLITYNFASDPTVPPNVARSAAARAPFDAVAAATEERTPWGAMGRRPLRPRAAARRS